MVQNGRQKKTILLHFYENPSKALGYQGWDKILMITLISRQKSPTPKFQPQRIKEIFREIAW